MSHGEPFLLRGSGVAGSRGFSPTALIFSFNWPVEEEHTVRQGKVTNKICATIKSHGTIFQSDLFFYFSKKLKTQVATGTVNSKFKDYSLIFLWIPAGGTYSIYNCILLYGITTAVRCTKLTAHMNFSLWPQFSTSKWMTQTFAYGPHFNKNILLEKTHKSMWIVKWKWK